MTELQARREIAHYCALLWQRRLVTGTSGNVSVRLDDETVLVTPSQMSLRAVRAQDVVRVGIDGSSAAGMRPSSELPLHLAAYAVRPDVRAIVHTHPTFCVVWSKTGRIFERDTVGARETLGEVALTPYAPPGSQELAQSAAREFARGVDTVLMALHGVSAAGPTLEHAFNLTDLCEEAARIAYFGKAALTE